MELGNEKDLKRKTEAEEVSKEIDWYTVGAVDKRVVNFEKCHALVLDKPFDPKFRMYAFGASILFEEEDGTFSPEYDLRCPNLSLNSLSVLIENLSDSFKEYGDKITFIKDLSELPFNPALFYDSEDTFKETSIYPKIVVTFKDDSIDQIFLYKISTIFTYRNTLITFNSLLKQKQNEFDRNMLIQNLFVALTTHAKKETSGGLLKP